MMYNKQGEPDNLEVQATEYAKMALWSTKLLQGTPLVKRLAPILFVLLLVTHFIWLFSIPGNRKSKQTIFILTIFGCLTLAYFAHFFRNQNNALIAGDVQLNNSGGHDSRKLHVLGTISATSLVATLIATIYVASEAKLGFANAFVCVREMIVLFMLTAMFCILIRNEQDAKAVLQKIHGRVDQSN